MSTDILPSQLPTLQRLGVDDLTNISPTKVAAAWFYAFSNAIKLSDVAAVMDLFLDNGFWKDILALTWDFRTLEGKDAIKNLLDHRLSTTGFEDLRLCHDKLREPELQKMFPDVVLLRVCFEFETRVGKGIGICYLAPVTGSKWKAYTLFTCLESLKDFPDQVGSARPPGGQRGTWKEQRHQETEFLNNDPTAIIVGAGHTGLEIAARLKYLGVPSLIVDQKPRVGDNWRERYKALYLHDTVWYDQTPYLQFPSTWPVNCPAGKLADWFESYAEHLELNVWMSSTITRTIWNNEAKIWTVEVNRGGNIRVLKTKHLVFATGVGGHPKIPDIPGKSDYGGEVLHSSQFTSAENYVSKKAIVVGACTSGHDIAHDFLTHGVDVTMYQRSPVYVLSAAAAPTILGPYYREGFPTELADIYGASFPSAVVRLIHQRLVPQVAQTTDKDLLENLAKVGFETNLGPDGAGLVPLFYGRAGGYYINTGTSEHVINGGIKLKSRTTIACYTQKGLKFSDGTELEADVIIFSTGFGDPRDSIRDVCGPEVADKVTPVWGMDDEEQIRGAWRYCGHEGLWRAIGNLAMSRFHSLHLALQIKAIEVGMLKRSEIAL